MKFECNKTTEIVHPLFHVYLFGIVVLVPSGRNPGNGHLYLRKTDRCFPHESGNIQDAVFAAHNR